MMSKVPEIQFEYKINKIQTVKFFFEEVDESILDQLFESNSELGISINSNLVVSKEDSTIAIDIHTHLVRKVDSTILVEHIGRTKYQVVGLDSVHETETDLYNIPDGFIILISSIAYTHSRALLTVELSSTCYRDKYFLPIINPSEVFGLKKEVGD